MENKNMEITINKGHKLWNVRVYRYEALEEVNVWVDLHACERNMLTGRFEKRSYQGTFKKEFHGVKREEKLKSFLNKKIGEEIL